MHTLERTSLWQRLRGAREADLFGPRGRLPTRGQPDTTPRFALLSLAAMTAAGFLMRAHVPRGIWLDEAIVTRRCTTSCSG